MLQTKSGVWFDSTADIWSYRDGVNNISLDFGSLVGVSQKYLESAKQVLAWYAQKHSPDHLKNMFTRLQHFILAIARTEVGSIGSADILNYRTLLKPDTAWYVGTLSGLLKKWNQLGYPGVDQDAVLLLKQLRLKGNAKGVSVLTMDTHDGPFTNLEVEAIQSTVNNAYATGAMDSSQFVLVWLYLLLGQRNKQHAALKVSDVIVTQDASGHRKYAIRMPSAKKRTNNPRESSVERPLVEQFGEVLVSYAEGLKLRYASLLPDSSRLPLFISLSAWKEAQPGFEYHRTAVDIGQYLTRTLESLSIVSERTGKPMSISAVRFRRTIGTRAAEEGHGPLVIARLLDHSDIQNVGVYVANSPEIIERIDRAVALEMAPLAQAFEGKLAEEDMRGRDPSKRIIDLRIDRSGESMGACGKSGYCGFNAPIACYTCHNFVAWVNGPHEAVLLYLLRRRENLLATSDKRMAAVNDRTIFAVAAVIQKCQKARPDPAIGTSDV